MCVVQILPIIVVTNVPHLPPSLLPYFFWPLSNLHAHLSLICTHISLLSPSQPPRRKKIDRSMIGLPQNFQHTGHIGSSDFGSSDVSETKQNTLALLLSSKALACSIFTLNNFYR